MATKTKPEIVNREDWLNRFVDEIIPKTGMNEITIAARKSKSNPNGDPIKVRVDRAKVRISCGFPSHGGRSGNVIGECWHADASSDGRFEIFIHPKLTDAVAVGQTIVHELLHAGLPKGTGHRAPFAKASAHIGLKGKPTHNVAGEDLAAAIKSVVNDLGPYPHAALSSARPKQPTNLIKQECPDCGRLERGTRKWIMADGAAICPRCNVSLVPSLPGWEEPPRLQIIEATRILRIDDRFHLRHSRVNNRETWVLIDFGGEAEDGEDFFHGQPRIKRAESIEDAISLAEAIRDGSLTYADIEDSEHEWDDEPEDETFDELDDMDLEEVV